MFTAAVLPAFVGVLLLAEPAAAADAPAQRWLLGQALKLPSELTNQESGYFSIVAGLDGRLYIGAAKYGVNASLIEYDPKSGGLKPVVDVMKTIGADARGFAAQAKIHTRNN